MTGCLRLSADLRQRFGVGNGGCYNPQSRLSGGGPSPHVAGRAIDLMVDFTNPVSRVRGDALFDFLYARRHETNAQQIIGGHRIWTAARQHEGIRHYAPSDHMNHVHYEPGEHAALHWNGWENVHAGGDPTPTPTPPEEDDLTPEQANQLNRIEMTAAAAAIATRKIDEVHLMAIGTLDTVTRIEKACKAIRVDVEKVLEQTKPRQVIATPLGVTDLPA